MCPETIKSYIFALSKLQQLKGFEPVKFAKSMAKKLIYSAKNARAHTKQKTKTKKTGAMSLRKLAKINKFLRKNFKKSDRQALWTCMTVAFFGSFRMGELVAGKSDSFDKTSTLLWKDVQKHKNHLVINLKNAKSGQYAEAVYLFPFPIKSLCPVHALLKLERNQKKNRSWEEKMPVFRLKNGSNITKQFLNSLLKKILSTEKHNISCKSFRCGIPSSLGNSPEIANDQHIKGWGRWNSKSFLRYEHYGLYQKKWVYDKVVMSLLKNISGSTRLKKLISSLNSSHIFRTQAA
jgi:hypothetical protein